MDKTPIRLMKIEKIFENRSRQIAVMIKSSIFVKRDNHEWQHLFNSSTTG